MNNNEAKVFGDGNVTIAVSQLGSSLNVYVGQIKIDQVTSLSLETDKKTEQVTLKIGFPKSNNEDEAKKIEENMRQVRLTPWITVTQD